MKARGGTTTRLRKTQRALPIGGLDASRTPDHEGGST
jgi:hypothetical protein